jgi:hypothetical protein
MYVSLYTCINICMYRYLGLMHKPLLFRLNQRSNRPYIYIYIYKCIYIFIYIYIYIYLCICICTYTYLYTNILTHFIICMFNFFTYTSEFFPTSQTTKSRIFVYIYIYIYICMYVYTYICKYICIDIHWYKHVYIPPNSSPHPRRQKEGSAGRLTQESLIWASRTLKRTCIYVYLSTFLYDYMYVLTYTFIYIHTSMYRYMLVYSF